MPFQHRFAGPLNAKLEPYKQPSILNAWLDDEVIDHIVLKFNRAQTKDECFLYLCSDRDEYMTASWTGTQAELTSQIDANMLTIPDWSMRIQMSPRMAKCLLQN